MPDEMSWSCAGCGRPLTAQPGPVTIPTVGPDGWKIYGARVVCECHVTNYCALTSNGPVVVQAAREAE